MAEKMATETNMETHVDMLLPSPEQLTLEFQDLRYCVPDLKGKSKEVLHDVTGQIRSGRLTAILGPSGAGKTSLLNVLAGFKTTGVSGSVLVNGVERDLMEFRTQACYIPQELSLLGQLTAKETLTIAARLKLATSDEEQRVVVSEILDLLGLTRSKDTAVLQMSGGEKKRLSIGVELITNPPIMLFDEPTSGLDNVSSSQVISHLRSLASAGRAVACVIHQPSSQLCELFDDMILLAAGSVLYCGPTNEILPVFEAEGFKCPSHYNRADFALEVACGERGKDLSRLLKRAHMTRSDLLQEERAVTEETKMITVRSSSISFVTAKDKVYCTTVSQHPTAKKSLYPISQMRQFWILFKRCMLCNSRDPYLTHIRIFCHLFVGALIGVVYLDIGNEASKIDSNTACIFFFIMFLFFCNVMPTILTFPLEINVVVREHLNNWYSLPPYFFASCLSHIPLQVVCPISFLSLAYFMTGQPMDAFRISMVIIVAILLVNMAQTIGLVAGAAFNPQLGLVVVPVSTIPVMLFSGFFLRIPDIPYYFRWISYVSYFKHSFEPMITSVYGYNRTNLACSEPYCHFKSPTKFLEHIDMQADNYYTNIVALVAWGGVMYAILFAVLKWRIHKCK